MGEVIKLARPIIVQLGKASLLCISRAPVCNLDSVEVLFIQDLKAVSKRSHFVDNLRACIE